jgi:hypothetical protein
MPFFSPFFCAGASRLQLVFGMVVAIIFLAVIIAFASRYQYLHGTDRGVDSARTLNTLLAQYATDNDGVYPVGEGTRAEGKSEGIALDLLLNNYTPNPDIFAVGETPGYSGTAKDYADLGPENLSWDFTAGANATTGIRADAPDSLPVLYTTGETVDYRPGQGVTLSGNGPFGTRGMIVALKSGAVTYRPASNNVATALVSPDLKDTGTYTQIRP